MKKKLLAAAAFLVLAVCLFGGILVKNHGVTAIREAFFGVREITFQEKELALEPGEEKALNAELTPKRANVKRVQWSSSDEAVVVVKDGTLSAQHEGTAVITAASGSAKAQMTVTVKLRQGSLTLDSDKFCLGVGQSKRLSAYRYPGKEAFSGVTYQSTAPQVASVDVAGTVTAKALGKAEIIATANGKRAYATVEVIEIPKNVSFGQSRVKMAVGQSIALPVTMEPQGADERGLNWKTSNAKVAEYQDGKIRAVGAGTCTITAVAEDKKAAITVTVLKTELVVKLSEKELTLTAGEKSQMEYILMTPSNMQHGTPKWESSNAKVASVDESGTVTAHQKGTAWITITTEIGQAMCKVTVK